MSQEKREVPRIGIHTAMLEVNGIIDPSKFDEDMSKVRYNRDGNTTVRVNVEPDWLFDEWNYSENGDTGCFDMEEMSAEDVEKILDERGKNLSDDGCKLKRLDLKFDWIHTPSEEIERINRLLVMCFYQFTECKRRNGKDTRDFADPSKMLIVSAKGAHYEVMFYDKRAERNHTKIMARLEIRHTRVGGKSAKWVIQRICCLLHELKQRESRACDLRNKMLLKKWGEYRKEEGNTSHKRLDFLREHEKELYTVRQVEKLLGAMGAENPAKAVSNFQSREKIHLLSKKEFEKYIDMLASKVYDFLSKK